MVLNREDGNRKLKGLFLIELADKLRKLSMLSGFHSLFGSFLAAHVRMLLLRDPVYYEGYKSGEEMSDLLDRFNRIDKDSNINNLTKAVE